MKIVFAGSGEFGVPSLDALRAAGHSIVQIITQPDRPAGRGRKLTPTPIATHAETLAIPIERAADIGSISLPTADLLVVIAFGQKIAEATIERFPLHAINLHASRLPKYRGAAPINAAILAGETITGNSVIRLAQRMDSGAVLGQSEICIGETETAGELHDRLATDGGPLIVQVVQELAGGRAIETMQDDLQATRALKMYRESSRLEWTRPADKLARQIRGMYPWPGCRVELRDSKDQVITSLTLVRATAEQSHSAKSPGTILESGAIATGEGSINILEVQPQGKQPWAYSHSATGIAGRRAVDFLRCRPKSSASGSPACKLGVAT